MELKEGYKQTELGLIPEDWDVKLFQEVMDGFSSGQTPYREIKRYYTGEIPWITSGELNYNVINDTIEKITIDAVKNTSLKIIPKGTFLIAITGLEAAGTRGSCAITGIDSTTNQSCMALYPKPNKLTVSYLFQYYRKFGDKLAFEYCQGTKQQSYTGAIAKKLPIIVPGTIKEQTAIATALSDADAYITSLEKLIEKKCQIKQGAMQELLKPKDDWEAKTIGDIAYVISGGTPSSFISEFWNGDINWFTPTEIGDSKYSIESIRKISKKGFENSSAKTLPIGTILLTSRAGIGDLSILKVEATTNQGFQSLVVKEGNYNEYVYYLMKTLKNELLNNSSGSTFLEISPSKIRAINIKIPDLKLQIEIAKILSDIDIEIFALEQKLKKANSIKQGMMQNLLTGKIRLV